VNAEVGIVTLRVDNWKDMLAYYRDKMGLKPRMVAEDVQYAMFDTGTVRFAIEGPAKPAFAKRKGKGALVTNFKVEDIKTTLAELQRNGVKVLTEIKQGPNYDYVVVEDPEGNEQIVYQRVQR
jgi:predicted enzyme related to lactoylglutathione lyase